MILTWMPSLPDHLDAPPLFSPFQILYSSKPSNLPYPNPSTLLVFLTDAKLIQATILPSQF
jgi:hypothetical protein